MQHEWQTVVLAEADSTEAVLELVACICVLCEKTFLGGFVVMMEGVGLLVIAAFVHVVGFGGGLFEGVLAFLFLWWQQVWGLW